jgi:hypothetical protein
MSRPILFVVSSATAYRIHQPFASFCVQQGRTVAFVYDREPDAFFETICADAAKLGGTAVSLDATITPGPHKAPWSLFNRPGTRAKVFNAIRESSPSGRVKAFSDIIFGRLSAATALIKRISPAVMVVAEDGVAGPLAMIAAAQRAGTAVVTLPFGYGTQQDFEIALDAKKARGEVEQPTGPEGDAIRQYAPEWIKRGAHEGALLFPAEYIVVLESAGIHVRNAWVVHGGTADRLCVESRQMMRLYQSEGLPPDKLVMTGSPYGDFLLNALGENADAQAAFRKPRKISSPDTRILVSWPPSYHSERGSASEFPTYLAMTTAILEGLRSIPRARVTVSLHPAVSAEDRAAIAGLGVELSSRYVLELIPCHDIYVSYYSSTIRWAVASGKPVLNYDAYQLRLDVYDAAPGVVTLTRAAELIERARQLAQSDEAFTALAAEQVRVAPEWGMLDAPAMPRILDALDAAARD